MPASIERIQKAIAALGKGRGACFNLGTVYSGDSVLLELALGSNEIDDPTETGRAAVSGLIAQGIDDLYDSDPMRAKACQIFFLTDRFRQEFEDEFQVRELTQKARVEKAKKQTVSAVHKSGVNPLRGTGKQSLQALAWELAAKIYSSSGSLGSVSAAREFVSRDARVEAIAEIARDHYKESPGLTFSELGRTILDSTGRCTGKARLKVVVAMIGARTVGYEERLDFEGVLGVNGTYRVAIVMSRGAQDEWYRSEDCPSLYYMTDAKLFRDLKKQVDQNPSQVFRMQRVSDDDDGGWAEVPVHRDEATEQRLYEIAAAVTPRIKDLKRDQILVLTATADFDQSEPRELRKSVSLRFPVSDGAVRWRADYPIYLDEIEIVRDGMAAADIVVKPSWYMSGPPTDMNVQEQLASPAKSIVREPKRWVLRDHGVALRWDVPAR